MSDDAAFSLDTHDAEQLGPEPEALRETEGLGNDASGHAEDARLQGKHGSRRRAKTVSAACIFPRFNCVVALYYAHIRAGFIAPLKPMHVPMNTLLSYTPSMK